MSQPGMWLEIRRGKTNFPLRPVSGDRFLIGAGSHCHLQLGGDDVPMLHSLLVIDGNKAHLEAVVGTPTLLVNGEVMREVELHDEDTVQIGQFEFIFHRVAASEPTAQVVTATTPLVVEDDAENDLTQMSAIELVQRIEDEVDQICAYDRGREQGAIALLQAVRQGEVHDDSECVPIASYRSDDVVADLAEQLRRQSLQLAERESECLLRMAQLQEAQERLTQQMAEFARQVTAWSSTEGPNRFRASA